MVTRASRHCLETMRMAARRWHGRKLAIAIAPPITRRTSMSLFQYGSQARLLRTTPHPRQTNSWFFQNPSTSAVTQPSQHVRKEHALEERFTGSLRLGQSIAQSHKLLEPWEKTRGSGKHKERIAWKLPEKADRDAKICRPIAS